ncbi:hypothetical protein DYB37_004322 [Aphanomyces astaci]|uniref:RxLR effector protein n=2 Tax=Aphanomyces astaci TaxID=112090 RepID=A0A3R6Y4C3_APHAT|nr:hypothetical protein DYB35_000631 [Aphanomyces astaci]RHZ23303.1 hypothetical protein DYB37_004322 [Aphanomyces astaci]
MFAKLAVIAAFAVLAVSGAAHNSTTNSSNVIVPNNSSLPAAAATPYGRVLFAKLLEQLKIEHIDSKPLDDGEYNNAVNELENLLTGKTIGKSKAVKQQLRASLRSLLARMTPEELEQLFNDVAFELTVKLFKKTFGDEIDVDALSENKTAASDVVTFASQNETFTGLSRSDVVYVGSAFGGCILSVAAALAVIGARKKKSAAAAAEAASDNVVDEIEAAENIAAAQKDDDVEVEDIKTDSPAVVSKSFPSSHSPISPACINMKLALFATSAAVAAAALNRTNGTNATHVNSTNNVIVFHNGTNGTAQNASRDAIKFTQAHERSRLFDYENNDVVIVGSGLIGCLAVAAVAFAAVKKTRSASSAGASDASVLAEDVVDEIEAVENAAEEPKEDAPASPADKDEDVHQVSTDSPSVVSV